MILLARRRRARACSCLEEMPRKRRDPDAAGPEGLFAKRLNELFDTRLDPATGKPYSARTVAHATNISQSSLSDLRRGKVEAPGIDKVAVLARFFGVDPGYLTGSEPVEYPEVARNDQALREALENPVVRDIAIQTRTFNREQWSHFLAMLEHQREIDRITEERIRREYERKAAAERPPRDISTGRRRTDQEQVPPLRGATEPGGDAESGADADPTE
jgi:transcriptional regulator with XRE-family HTH domain